jgi:conserved hypothetical protein, YceG family
MLDHGLDLAWEEDRPRRGWDDDRPRRGWDDDRRGWGDDRPRRRRPAPPNRRAQQQRRRKKRKRRQKGKSYTALIISLSLLLLVGLGGYWGIVQLQKNQSIREFLAADYEQGDMGDEVTFRVEQGDFGSVIAANLLEAGVIKSRAAFVNICSTRKVECESIQPGAYKVQLNSPAKVVFEILIDPKNAITSKFTIQEGLSVIKTIKSLSEQTGIPLEDFQEAIKDPAALGIEPEWFQRLDGKAAATTSVEGFLFPDTYFFDPTASAADILKMMVDQFKRVANDVGLVQQAQARQIGVYEMIIAASIAQVEVKEADFAKATRVVYNRAYHDPPWVLGMDTAVNYWLELQGQSEKSSSEMLDSEIHDLNNPYNTHDKAGLPIGPISNPGKAALQAAANPEAGDWMFFVAIDQAGTTAFAVTEWEHCQNIATAIRNGVLGEASRC